MLGEDAVDLVGVVGKLGGGHGLSRALSAFHAQATVLDHERMVLTQREASLGSLGISGAADPYLLQGVQKAVLLCRVHLEKLVGMNGMTERKQA